MIAILKEEDIDLIVKSYMYSDNTNYILRLIKVFSKESERYCLFSFDYMSDQAKNYSLISYKDKKCTCTCCNHSVQDSMLYLLEDNLITIENGVFRHDTLKLGYLLFSEVLRLKKNKRKKKY